MERIEDMAFEQALAELEQIVEKLEGEGLSLDETVTLYQRGRELADHCQQVLDTVELRVQQLTPDSDGTMREVPFDLEDAP